MWRPTSRKIALSYIIAGLLAAAMACSGAVADVQDAAEAPREQSLAAPMRTEAAADAAVVEIVGVPLDVSTHPASLGAEASGISTEGDWTASASPSETIAPTSAAQTASDPTQPGAPPDAAPAKRRAIDIVGSQQKVFTDLYIAALPSIVHIDVSQVIGGQLVATHQGSGFVWDDDGVIVTNHHVVEDAAQAWVTFEDGNVFEAEIIGSDQYSDLAAVRIDAPDEYLKPVSLGDSRDLMVGQLTFAIGNPFGRTFTMTSGIISGLDRTISGSSASAYRNPSAIQTDAALNAGNSGGPLFDIYGKVIGINSQIISQTGTWSGVGFAIPVNTAKIVIPALIDTGSHTYAYIGISGTSVTSWVAEQNDLDRSVRGVLIRSVVRGGPADDAGFRGPTATARGDVITAIDGTPMITMADLIAYLVDKTRPGQTVTIDVIRPNGDTEKIDVVLEARPGS